MKNIKLSDELKREISGFIHSRNSLNFSTLTVDDERWSDIIDLMADRVGSGIKDLSELADFRLFKRVPSKGRYIKEFGRAYALTGESLTGTSLSRLRGGHAKRKPA